MIKKRRPKRSCKESNPKSVTLKGDAANPLPRYSEKPGRNPEKIISKQNEKPTFWPLTYFLTYCNLQTIFEKVKFLVKYFTFSFEAKKNPVACRAFIEN